jgi:hypothetical protein
MKLKTTTILLALGLATSGCSLLDYKSVSREDLTNTQGHVIGQKETLFDHRSGEQVAKIALFVPRIERGEVVGYEERVAGGTVLLRDLNGKRIGNRWNDLRSRSMNAGNKGITIVFHSRPSERTTMAAAPSIDDLMHLARLN